ncbi:MAG: saccharopine dehydrogenase [Acidobacteria bacterium]|nr:MAG: saccharopine dehydrogenase [Acidobacteriota bacterium]
MKRILVLGAGYSSPFLVRYLLDHAQRSDWSVTVADRDEQAAARRVDGHPRGRAVRLDSSDALALGEQIAQHDVVVSLVPPRFQPLVAWAAVQHGRHMVTASYRDQAMRDLDQAARQKGILLLPEVGLDPGIDLMSAMRLIRGVEQRGGIVESFESYGAGVLSPESEANPLRYAITWNPRNVVMAAEFGACYVETGRIKIVPWHNVFRHTWPIEVPGLGTMEAYPNRDSLAYQETFGLDHAHTVIRGTLRNQGFCEVWQQVVRLGLPNENLHVPRLEQRSFRELVEMCLPRALTGTRLESRVANYLGISATGEIMRKLEWLGLFDDAPIAAPVRTPAEALQVLLERKLALPDDEADVVVIQHEMETRWPDEGDRRERTVATFVHRGDPGGMTAMARTVGFPAAVVVRLLLEGRLTATGSQLPTIPEIYEPVLAELEREGLVFEERTEPLERNHQPHQVGGSSLID